MKIDHEIANIDQMLGGLRPAAISLRASFNTKERLVVVRTMFREAAREGAA